MGETVLGPINPEQAPSVAQSLDSSAPSPRALWQVWRRIRYVPDMPMDAHEHDWDEDWPPELERLRGLFEQIIAAAMAEAKCCPDCGADPGTVAAMCGGDCDWARDDGGAKQSPPRTADPPVLNQEPAR